MSKAAIYDLNLRSAVENAAKQLISFDHSPDRSALIFPIWLPTGSAVTVSVWQSGTGQGFVVSDAGDTYLETLDVGAQRSYARIAPSIAESLGLVYRDKQFVAENVAADQIAGAASVVAEAAKKAFDHAAEKLAERRMEEANDILYERLVSVFDRKHIARNVSFRGASTHEWSFANAVEVQGHQTLFEAVSSAHLSIYAASTKFQDVKRLEHPPRRVSAVESRKDFGDLLGVLAQSSDVIELTAPDSEYRQLAA